MSKVILALLISQVSFAALPPAPKISCYYDVKGYPKIEVSFQKPIEVEGKVITQFEITYPHFPICPDLGDIDVELSRNYRFYINEFSLNEIQNGECRLVLIRNIHISIPLRRTIQSTIDVEGLIPLSKTVVKVLKYSDCDDR